MNVAITGAAGLFGHALVQVFGRRHAAFPMGRGEADITKYEEVRSAFQRLCPEVVVHAAAIPSPDVCEEDPPLAYLVNVHGTRHVVEAAREIGAAVAYISSDAVFDGEKQTPYRETDLPNPPTVYGRTKLRGEKIVATLPRYWIFRVAVLFGPGRANFIDKGLRKMKAGEDYVVTSDQTGGALYTLDGAQKILEVVESGRCGLFHLANSGICTRYELAKYAAEKAGLDLRHLIGIPSGQMGRPAKRLKYAVMEMRALAEAGFNLPRPWQAALDDYLRTVLPLGSNVPA
ncbi:MAG TPA: NAD(P)-dependent oxidoreductase [Terriglobia bacterium]|jgi:dTDP-4-dehydrorhamnose reductase|nr:NAD(P)-dependent oxidoreductase [Terriglobia bacterium]